MFFWRRAWPVHPIPRIRYPRHGSKHSGCHRYETAEGDQVIGMEILDEGASILTVTSNGFGKRTATQEYRVQSRGGKGIITIKTGGRNGEVVGIRQSPVKKTFCWSQPTAN